jgi:TnpA family transposase
MGLAKLLVCSLCPRLAALRERKLYVTAGQYVPKPLRAVAFHIPLKSLHTHWDELLRLAASVREGWCSASQVLDRMGSTVQGDPLYQAAVTLGRLVRTQYLCDYFSKPAFRHSIPAHSTTANQFISCSERFALMRPDPSVAEVATSNGQSRVLSRRSRTW